MTEQQKHLKQVIDQQKEIAAEVRDLNAQIEFKKEILFKLQGVIEYLTQLGVKLAEEDSESPTQQYTQENPNNTVETIENPLLNRTANI